MMNAFRQPQTILVLGGRSDIACAITRRMASPNLRTVVLAQRPSDAATSGGDLDDLGEAVEIVTESFDATAHDGHAEFIEKIADDHGDLDVVIQAFGQLGSGVNDDPVGAARLVDVNMAGAVSSGLAVADRLKRQGHGTLVVLSSVAGVRTRPSNFVYGATKAGQDAFSTGLGHALAGTGARVLTVRPGFVRSAMTDGLDEAPFACDPDDVAQATVKALEGGASVVWAPGILRYVFGILRVVPGFVWRRLDR